MSLERAFESDQWWKVMNGVREVVPSPWSGYSEGTVTQCWPSCRWHNQVGWWDSADYAVIPYSPPDGLSVEGSMVLIYIGSSTQVHKACTVYVRPSVIIHIRAYPDFILFTQPSHIVQVYVVPVGRQCGFLCDMRADDLTNIHFMGRIKDSYCAGVHTGWMKCDVCRQRNWIVSWVQCADVDSCNDTVAIGPIFTSTCK